ncbi:hypothetical protein M404DRAFT_6880 [Pisolithus tinctorius Marx 270]|uniref:Sec63-domain-containing protein n=1 Tax=Pisolithus tinctorius Marx 270 TaxID=870435 RepID=A0A0C3PFZ9_PISTI|nr:hypothetical protein M404DRAFT_6880 [Pisolithus tinctorius Marx 270]
MLNFADHIDSLTSSSRETGGNEVKTSLLDEWTRSSTLRQEVYSGLGRELVQSRAVVLQQLAGLRFQVSTGVSSASGRSSGNIYHSADTHCFNGATGCGEVSFDPEDARLRLEETLKANAARPLFTKNADYLEVIVPPAKAVFKRPSERLIAVSELDILIKGSFAGYTHLNRIQSIVYPTAYGSNENILICAPTGAGKTDVAMLTILRVLDQHRRPGARELPTTPTIDRDSFKIVYVAPMKALASEITQKLRRRLKWLLIQVRELTGDMQLTKSEIAETQIIVTTPEKWDVVTRKPAGEGELGSRLKLLIIDEVHLLNEDRGAVIETIVARTLRQAEASQSVIRIVGLSATLPNYIDVADFLSVSRYTGLFYFDSSFRPIPLEQHFIGIRGKAGSMQAKRNLDQVTFEKVSELVRQGHQVMVFVHARKETVNAAFALKDAAAAEGSLLDYSCEDNPQWNFYRKSIGESRNKEMKQLFDYGFGIHHAGMLRSDRNLIERLFKERAIKVLCCTATLAWGVNLPAHAVIIKGTEVYDSAKGKFVDLSVLDVLQVFGRAGRPGLETSGEGYICTSEEKLPHYLDAVTSQTPIESKFESGMKDALNAEIALGTVSSVSDGVRWLGYTYLFVRMKKNPFQYGLSRETVANNPVLVETRRQAIKQAANQLAKLKMIDFDADAETFTTKDIGQIAAKYYVRHQSIEIWDTVFKTGMSEADVLRMLSMSTEVRESEVKELEHLMGLVPCEVYGGTDTNQGKVNILLQAHISRLPIQDFALISDSAYVAQNGGRIIRALLEMAIGRKWANTTVVLAAMCKAVEKRMWPFDEPMRQFPLKDNIIYGLTNLHTEYHPKDLASMTAAELGELIRLNEGQGLALLKAAKQFPFPELSASLRISRSLNDPTDLASWLGVESRELYSFLPRDREQSLSCSVQTYSMPISEALFKALAKPAYAAMGLGSFTESAIVAVPSRAHCTTIAQELITQHNLNSVTETGFLAKTASAIDVEERLGHSEDHIAANFASRGVGIFHRGISDTTRERILELFAEGVIRVLVVTREACWRLPARAGAVVVVGTQYICVNPSTSERQLRDYTLLELMEMQSWAVQQSFPGHFTLFCPVEDGEMFSRFLNDDGLPLESKLLETDLLSRWYRESMEGGTLRNKEDAVQALSFTFMARRLVSNPTYYDVEDSTRDEVLSSISQRLGN